MNNAEPKLVEENEDTFSYELEDESSVEQQEAPVEEASNEDSRTIVREDEKELENYSENVQKRINQLTAKRKQALEAEEAALTYAKSLQDQNKELQKRLNELDQGYMSEYGSRVESQTADAKRMLKEGYDAGDVEKIAEAQDLMARLAIEKERLRIQKARAEQKVEQEVEAPQVPEQQPRRQQELDPKLKTWMGNNSWFGTDAVMTGGAKAIHEQIVSEEGFDPTTDEYYAEIDRRMRLEFPQKFQEKRQSAPAVTPASSNGRSATKSGRKKTVELSAGQVAMAKKLGISLEQMAKEVAKIEQRKS